MIKLLTLIPGGGGSRPAAPPPPPPPPPVAVKRKTVNKVSSTPAKKAVGQDQTKATGAAGVLEPAVTGKAKLGG